MGTLPARTEGYKILHDAGDNPEFPYKIVPVNGTGKSDDWLGPCLTKQQAQTFVLGVNLLLDLVKNGAQIGPSHPDNLAKAARQQELCENALAHYRDILRQAEAGA